MRTRIATAALLLLCTVILLIAQTGDEIFRQARNMELIDGDIPAAIQLYERVVRDFSSNRVLVAQSLLQLGECYERLNQPAQSEQYFQRIVDSFKDQIDTYNRASARLNELLRNRQPVVANTARGGAIDPPGVVVIPTSPTDDPYSFALSPDGRSLVYHAIVDGKSQLWLRRLDTNQIRALPGTNTSALGRQAGGSMPFWSPDNQSIGFFADGKLKTLHLASGTVKPLADAPSPRGGAWGDGVIVYSPISTFGPLYKVPVAGGKATEATQFEGGRNHRSPYFLPDGQRFIFCAVGGAGLSVGSLSSLETGQFLGAPGTGCADGFAAPDYIVSYGNPNVNAWRVEMQSLRLVTSLPSINAAVATNFFAALSVSTSGAIAYRSSLGPSQQFSWFDRSGRKIRTLGIPDAARHCCPRLSPNGEAVAFGLSVSANSGFRVMDTVSGQAAEAVQRADTPVWSPNNNFLAFSRQENLDPILPFANVIITERAGRSSKRVVEDREHKYPVDWSANALLYQRISLSTGNDLYVLPLEGSDPAGQPVAVASTTSDERNGRFSPDGRWIAYEASDGDGYEIYVQAFPVTSRTRKKISLSGGTNAEWGRNGRELYFLSRDNHLMVAAVSITTNGQEIVVSKPTPLFKDPLPAGAEYTVTSDGERFLINAPVENVGPPIKLLRNWIGGPR